MKTARTYLLAALFTLTAGLTTPLSAQTED